MLVKQPEWHQETRILYVTENPELWRLVKQYQEPSFWQVYLQGKLVSRTCLVTDLCAEAFSKEFNAYFKFVWEQEQWDGHQPVPHRLSGLFWTCDAIPSHT